MLELNKIYQGDCLEVMKNIDNESINMILCDLPYGTTSCSWDTIIPFKLLWEQYERIIKDNGAIVLTASQPFTSKLIMSNINLFRYELIWEKDIATGFLDARRKPMKIHENVLIFYKHRTTYNPQMKSGKPYRSISGKCSNSITKDESIKCGGYLTENSGERFPTSINKINTEHGLHPTQKPVVLFEYLIKTYTNKGNLILDNCAGSGTTGVAAKNLDRNYILIEQDEKYYKIAKTRIKNTNQFSDW